MASSSVSDRDTFLNEQQAVEFFNGIIPRRTFQYWRQQRQGGPPWVKLGRHCLYRLRDLQDFVDAGLVEPEPAKKR